MLHILPEIVASCVDIISISLGKFVAESKYLKEREKFTSYIKNGQVKDILALLTNVDVERRVLRRAFVKASTYGQDILYSTQINADGNPQPNRLGNNYSEGGSSSGFKVDPTLIVEIYRDMIIPLTKDVEVRYLYHRVGEEPPPVSTYFDLCRGPMDAFVDPNALRNLGI